MDGSERDCLTVVVVDDAVEVRSLVRTRLRLSGRFTVLADGGNGLDAVALAAQHQPDVVLLDVSMPHMDGLEALPRIRTVSPETRVVMYSGFDETGLAARAVELGAIGFLQKSVPIHLLADRIHDLVATGGDSEADAPTSSSSADETSDEAMLSQHLERFREVFEDAAIGMATMTLAGHVVRANRALAILLGRDLATMTGASYSDLAAGLDTARFTAALEQAGGPAAAVVELEHRIVVDGVEYDVRSTLAPVVDAENRALYLFLQVQDVTAQRAAEEELRQSEERFRLLVEAVQDYAIFMLDPEGRVASWNLGAQRSKGYAADEIIGQHFRVFYPPDKQAEKHPEWELDMAVRDGRYEEEGWRIRKDGSRFWANVVITAVHDADGELIGFTKVTRDMSERRAMLQRLEDANARLQQAAGDQADFLAVTAHELRTPVRVVTGCAETLAKHWAQMTEQERVELLDSMQTSAGRLRRLLDDLLTASRLEAGAVEMNIAPFALCTLLGEAASSLRSTNPEADVTVDCDERIQVAADADRVAQIIDNLLSNALRHGRPPVTLTAVERDDSVDVVIADAGAGVPTQMRARLFERFATGESRRGTGLGLFIVRELARAQGGDARYEQGPNGASRFIVSLPRATGGAVAGD